MRLHRGCGITPTSSAPVRAVMAQHGLANGRSSKLYHAPMRPSQVSHIDHTTLNRPASISPAGSVRSVRENGKAHNPERLAIASSISSQKHSNAIRVRQTDTRVIPPSFVPTRTLHVFNTSKSHSHRYLSSPASRFAHFPSGNIHQSHVHGPHDGSRTGEAARTAHAPLPRHQTRHRCDPRPI